ncbi:hypothetical protein BPOR_1035g00010 [Botrytis porri]|uniref:DUF7029 domain-containing protein n=1 Tax=Botrytis porri TaxID=87229 RepID=A0A4Z1KE14_9HELO|nr:hypothetical protein BPOR_1035g00010 [Botrytis porri]
MLFRYESLASLLACVEAVAALYSSNVKISQRDFSSRKTNSLGAINVRSAEQKRGGANFKLSLVCTHHYADHDSIIRGTHSRFASTSMKYNLPAVSLEDIELTVKNIICSKSTIIVEFPSANLLVEAEKEWKDFSRFLVISSHAGCNDQNSRAPYLVSKVEYVLKSNTAILSVRRIEWSKAYDTMEVKFGMRKYDSSALRIHSDLRKRITSTVSVSSSETISFPSAPSATPTSDTSVHDIGYSVPAGFNLGSFSTSTDGTGGSLSINCGNCSIEGSIELTQGVFTISDSSLDAKKAIPDIAATGPMWTPAIQGSISVSRNLNFTYGFDVSVPDKSSIRLNIGNLTESTSSSFSDSAITTLPLTATDPSISLTLSLALHSELLLGVNILSGKGSIAAGALLDLPALSVTISELTSVDENCNPAQNSSSSVNNLDYFSSLTNIVPQADIAIGLQAGIQLAIPDLHFVENVGTTVTLAGTSMLLPTQCMSFDGGKKEFVTPKATGSSSSSLSTGTVGSSKKSNAVKMVSVPVLGSGGFGGLSGCCKVEIPKHLIVDGKNCGYGYCPIGAFTCYAMGKQATLPPSVGVKGYPKAGESEDYAGLCAFACDLDYCPDTACGIVCGSKGNLAALPSYTPMVAKPASGLDESTYGDLCQFACEYGFCPPEACGTSTEASETVYVDQIIFVEPSPVFVCPPPCTFVMPSSTMNSETVITFPPISKSTVVGGSTLLSCDPFSKQVNFSPL